MKTNDHEVIFAIVNSGYAEDVMDIAREQGVRGGTILNARGVVREEAAAFFGITMHEDKQILMMVVESAIRDRVLNAIYAQMGMAKKARGIAFSLPVSDVAGLTPALGTGSRLLLILLMFLGRVGIITVGMAALTRESPDDSVRLPEGRILIG